MKDIHTRSQDFKNSRLPDDNILWFHVLRNRKIEKYQNSMLISSRLSSTEVEPVGFRRYSSQLQLSPQPKMLVRPSVCVCVKKFRYFLPKDFLDFWQEVRHWHSKKTDTARFSVKNRVAPYRATTSLKSWFLAILANLKCSNDYETSYLDFISHF